MYDSGVDLRMNPRLSGIDDVYIPRVTAGYGGMGYYGSKRYN